MKIIFNTNGTVSLYNNDSRYPIHFQCVSSLINYCRQTGLEPTISHVITL